MHITTRGGVITSARCRGCRGRKEGECGLDRTTLVSVYSAPSPVGIAATARTEGQMRRVLPAFGRGIARGTHTFRELSPLRDETHRLLATASSRVVVDSLSPRHRPHYSLPNDLPISSSSKLSKPAAQTLLGLGSAPELHVAGVEGEKIPLSFRSSAEKRSHPSTQVAQPDV